MTHASKAPAAPAEIAHLSEPPLDISYFSDLDHAAEAVIDTQGRIRPGALIAMNAEKLVRLHRTPDLFASCKAPLYFPDGVAALWFAEGNRARLPGVELWLKVLERAAQHGRSVMICGATRAVNDAAAAILRARYPALRLTCLDGFEQTSAYRDAVAETRPEVVFVAMGTPRQERLIGELQAVHPGAMYMGIGGSLDILTGAKRRAPSIFIRLRIEFAYRLLQEPTRLLRQLSLVAFVALFFCGRFGHRDKYRQRGQIAVQGQGQN